MDIPIHMRNCCPVDYKLLSLLNCNLSHGHGVVRPFKDLDRWLFKSLNSAFVGTSRPHFTLVQWSFLSFSWPPCLTVYQYWRENEHLGQVCVVTRFISDCCIKGKTWRRSRRTPGTAGKTATETDRSWKQVQQVTAGKTTTTTVPAGHSQISFTTRSRAAKGNRGAETWGGKLPFALTFRKCARQILSFSFLSCLGHGSKWISRNRLRADGEFSQEVPFDTSIEGIKRWWEDSCKTICTSKILFLQRD